MPRYYLDLYNGDGLTVDDDGQVFETRERLRREAIRILPDIVRDEMIESDRHRDHGQGTRRKRAPDLRGVARRLLGVVRLTALPGIDDKSVPTIICNRRPRRDAAPCGAGRGGVPNRRPLWNGGSST